MAMGGYNMNNFDIAGAAGGLNVAMSPEERQLKQLQNMIKAAEATNYDGDPEYYNQIKTLSMQAGIPIKQFKTNPFRLAKAGLLSFADMALLGLVPNSLYTPMNPAEEIASGIGAAAGLINPYGAAGALGRGAIGGLKAMPRWSRFLANKALGQSTYRKASKAYGGIGGMFGGKAGAKFMGGAGGGAGAAPAAAAAGSAGKARKAQLLLGAGKKGKAAASARLLGQGKPKLDIAKLGPKGAAVKQLGTGAKKVGTSKSAAIANKAKKVGGRKMSRKTKKLAGQPVAEAGKITIKTNASGGIPKSEAKRIAAKMKPKAYKRWQKHNGTNQIKFALTWAKNHPSLIAFA